MSYQPGTAAAQYSSDPFTPEQEARIQAIVRAMLPEIEAHLDQALAVHLVTAPKADQRQIVTPGAPEALRQHDRGAQPADPPVTRKG